MQREENCLQLVRDFLAGSHKILLGRYTTRFSVSTNSRRNVRLKVHLTFRQVKHNRHGSLTMHAKISLGIQYLFCIISCLQNSRILLQVLIANLCIEFLAKTLGISNLFNLSPQAKGFYIMARKKWDRSDLPTYCQRVYFTAADVPWLGLIVSTVVVESRKNGLKLTKCTDIFQQSVCQAHFQVDHVCTRPVSKKRKSGNR